MVDQSSVVGIRRPQFRVIASILVVFVALILWHFKANSSQKKMVNDGALVVTTIVAQSGEVKPKLSAFGQLIGREEVPVYTDAMQGRILEVLVDEGDHVKAGQRLATIDTALIRVQRTQQLATQQRAVVAFNQAEAALDEAKLQLTQARSEKVRGDKVAEDGLISKEVADQRMTAEKLAETRVKAAQNGMSMALADLSLANAQLAEVDLKLKQAEIVAPVAGTVVERKAVIGQLLSQTSEPQFIIDRHDAIEVELEIAANEVKLFKAGTPVTIEVTGDSNLYTGKVRRGAAKVSNKDQVAKVRVDFDHVPDSFSGQTAKVSLQLPSKSGLYLPDASVYTEGEHHFVFTVKDNKAMKVPVKIGARFDGLVEVLAGVENGMPIIDKFANFVRDGEPVQTLSASAAKP